MARLKAGNQYKIKWIDAFAQATWTDDEELDELITENEIPSEQSLYFLKQTKNFYIFTSGKPTSKNKEYGYIDIHGIPKGWLKAIKPL